MEPGKMKAVIGGVRYDTEKAQIIAHDCYWDGHNMERNGRNTYLYKTPNGRYFAVHLTLWQGREIDAQGVTYDSEVGRVSIIGVGLSVHPDIPAQMFSVLSREGINIDMISSTSNSITCVISSTSVDKAVSSLHKHFMEGEV